MNRNHIGRSVRLELKEPGRWIFAFVALSLCWNFASRAGGGKKA